MRDALLEILACPACRGKLAVQPGAVRAPDRQIEEGTLRCAGCGAEYPIEQSVPNFVSAGGPADVVQTTSGFARNWDEYNQIICDNAALNDELFRDWIEPLDPATLRDRENVHVIRADILHPPFKPVFEAIYCLGVVHHTPEPEKTFRSLMGVLAPAGIMAVWVYAQEGNGWITRFVTPLRTHVTSRLPHGVLRRMSLLLTVPVYLAAHAAAVVPVPYRRYLKHLRRYPFVYMSHIVYDHLVPEIAHYLPREELERWTQGLHASISDRNGNSWRLFVSRTADALPAALPRTG